MPSDLAHKPREVRSTLKAVDVTTVVTDQYHLDTIEIALADRSGPVDIIVAGNEDAPESGGVRSLGAIVADKLVRPPDIMLGAAVDA